MHLFTKQTMRRILTCLVLMSVAGPLFAATAPYSASPMQVGVGVWLIVIILALGGLGTAIILKERVDKLKEANEDLMTSNLERKKKRLNNYIATMDKPQIEKILNYLKKKKGGISNSANLVAVIVGVLAFLLPSINSFAQFSANSPEANTDSVGSQTGVVIVTILILIPILVGLFIMSVKVRKAYQIIRNKANKKEAEKLAEYIKNAPEEEVTEKILARKAQLDYNLQHNELRGTEAPVDKKGLITYTLDDEIKGPAYVEVKKKATRRSTVDPQLAKLVLWYLITATIWLILGTSAGEYLGIKLVSPDADHFSWLSFGRLRPVHTNAVFWGWASLGMLGLGHYVVGRVGNTKLYSYRLGWFALVLINLAVVIGSIALMSGINNGGGEFREYVWPIMGLFIVAVLLILYNFIKTIANRKTTEIYIANWYMVAALIFGTVIMLVAYLPFWQNGMGETIVQGYYMHQGVGMWFMMFCLGLIYYYLPQQLNRPIYSYSLGILAFWTQIVFYTVIGSHHFVFSPIPWWLQTVAIVGSVGMIIPVTAGATNFIMTFKGGWHKLTSSYVLPFFLVGIIFYWTGSMQGTAEAFRSTNLFWHFTDFTVAHSHMTMYGIITFILWACVYDVVPRLTGKEPPQMLVGAHFWVALVGLMFYSVPLMIGGTMKGVMWMEGKPFIDSVVFSAPYWLWRAVGGSLMWASHLIFAYNFYKMYAEPKIVDVRDEAVEQLTTSSEVKE